MQIIIIPNSLTSVNKQFPRLVPGENAVVDWERLRVNSLVSLNQSRRRRDLNMTIMAVPPNTTAAKTNNRSGQIPLSGEGTGAGFSAGASSGFVLGVGEGVDAGGGTTGKVIVFSLLVSLLSITSLLESATAFMAWEPA